MHNLYADDLWFGQQVESRIMSYPFKMVESIKEGRFWVAHQRGEALIQTSRTIESVKLMAAFGLMVKTIHIDQCDHCNGLMPLSYMHEDGPDDGDGGIIGVVVFCNDCYPQEVR